MVIVLTQDNNRNKPKENNGKTPYFMVKFIIGMGFFMEEKIHENSRVRVRLCRT